MSFNAVGFSFGVPNLILLPTEEHHARTEVPQDFEVAEEDFDFQDQVNRRKHYA
jgi:hypothetical protein